MALAYLYDPLKQWQDVRGVNNVNGWLEVFISGTQERAVAYSDFGGTLLPDRIGIDNDGRAVVIVDSEKAYRVEVHTANGDLLFTQYPVWTQQSGGGVIGSFVDIESSNGSLDVQKTVVGATTIYDLSVGTDSTEGLDWIRTNGYTTADGKLVPTYQEGPMFVGEHGIALTGGRYYHVTARLSASVTAMPYYNEFAVTFSGMKDGGDTESYLTRNFVADCSTELSQQYEVSFDVMPEQDVELFASISGLESGVSVGLLDIEVHRVYSGIPDIPDGMATKEWVREELSGYQQVITAGPGIELSGSMVSVDFDEVQGKLTAGENIVIDGNTISATAEPQVNADWDATSGVAQILNKPDLSVYATLTDLEGKQDTLTAGDSISIENNVISAIIPEYADADWIAASGEPGYIHNKPTFVPGDNIWINQGPYAITIGEVITPTNADWDATSGISEILNKPNLATVATTGNYADLTNRPDLSVYATQSDLSTGLAGKQDTLTAGNNITITNNVISATAEPQVNADWDATSGVAEILNKPTEKTLVAGDNITITDSNSTVTISAAGSSGADWDAASGQPGYIANKPDLGLFEARYGQTTYSEIMDAIYEHKIVFCPGQGVDSVNRMGTLTNFYTNPGSEYVEFEFYKSKTGTGVNDTVVIYRVDGNDNWTTEERDVKAGNISYPVTDVEVNGSSVVSGGVASVTVPAQVQTDWDATSGKAQILNKPDLSIYAQSANLATVATTGDYDDLLNKPVIPAAQVNTDWDATSGVAQLLNKPDLSIYAESSSLSPVATSGSYNDLTDTPTIPEGLPPYNPGTDEGKVLTVGSSTPYWNTPAAQVNADWDATSGVAQILNKPTIPADILFVAVYGTTTNAEIDAAVVAGKSIFCSMPSGATGILTLFPLTNYGLNLVEFTGIMDYQGASTMLLLKVESDVWSISQVELAESSSLATVATTGDYGDLTNKPSIPAAQVNSDWDATSGISEILHKPDLSIYAQSSSLSTVATTGDYDDLLNKPSIPAAQVNSDWDATSGVAEILNKPEQVSLVAGSNITITEGASTLTISSTSAPQVNADWDATSGVAQILNKPDLSVYAQSADLAAVATTGSYNSLTDTPTIPAAQVNSDWDATSGVQEILNKPDLVDIVAGPGIAIDNPDGNTLRVSTVDTETVLWSGDTGMIISSTDGTCQLSEASTNFERIRVYVRGSAQNINNDTNTATGFSEIVPVSNTDAYYSLSTGMYTNDGSAVHIDTCIVKINGSTFSYSKGLRFSMSGSTPVLNNTRGPFIVKIVGVHRIANN